MFFVTGNNYIMYFVYDAATRTGPTIITIYSILLVIVLVSNSLVIKVWLSKTNRSTSTITLSIIALYDTLTMIFGTLHKTAVYIAVQYLTTAACYLDPIIVRFTFFFHSMSSFATTFLAIQRCVVCVFPFVGPRVCGVRTIVIVTVVSTVVLSFVPLHDFIFYERHGNISKTPDNKTSVYCYLKPTTSLKKETLDRMEGNVRLFVYQVIPAFITSFCMMVCLTTVNRRKITTGKSTRDQETRRTTIMLVFIMLIFILGELPEAIAMFSKSFSYNAVLSSESYFWFGNVSIIVSYLVNIWVYIGMSKQFREGLKTTICGIHEKREQKNARTISSVL